MTVLFKHPLTGRIVETDGTPEGMARVMIEGYQQVKEQPATPAMGEAKE